MKFIDTSANSQIPYEIKSECSKFAQEVQRYVGFSQIILYGSYAKGTAHPWSDIDLAIISKNFHRMSTLKRKNLLLKACLEANTPRIQSIGFTPYELETNTRPRILNHIRQGVILFNGNVSKIHLKTSLPMRKK